METKIGYSTLWKAIIRPQRTEYEMNDMGPADIFVNGMLIHRTDLEIKSHQGLTI
jgi:hypothetical protein